MTRTSQFSIIAIAVGGALLAGRATPPAYQMHTRFSEEETRPWAGGGPADLQGQAFLKTVGGDIKTCAGEKVALVPATEYGRELVRAERTGAPDVANAAPRYLDYGKITTCDAQGNFLFSGLPARSWIIETSVHWGIPTGSVLFPVDSQGGVLLQEIALRAGLNRAILTGADQVR